MPTLREIASKKSTKGMAENPWGEIKKQWSTTLTPTAIKLLKDKAKEQGLSVSALIEKFARGE